MICQCLGGHVVFANIKRLAVENSDAPIERRRQEFLRDDQFGFLEQARGLAMKFLERVRFDDALREGTVGLLEDARESDFRRD